MMNTNLIDAAVSLVVAFNESEGIMEQTSTIKARVISWYNNSEIVDEEMLAAAAIVGEYTISMNWNDLLSIKEFYFPSEPIEYSNFHIGEIEEAQFDEFWR